MSLPQVDTSDPWGRPKFESSVDGSKNNFESGRNANGEIDDQQGIMVNGEGSRSQMDAENEKGGKLQASKESNCGSSCDWSISAKSVKGRRRTLEDRYLVIQEFPSNRFDIKVVAAVFDGHGGTEAAEFCHDNFQSFLMRAMSSQGTETRTKNRTSRNLPHSTQISPSSYTNPSDTKEGEQGSSAHDGPSSAPVARPQNNNRGSSSSRENSFSDNSGLSQVLRSTFLALDETFCQKYPKSNCGCTALVVTIDSLKSRVNFANVGDSAATVFRSGEACSFTSDPDQDKHLNDSESTDTCSEIVLLNDIHNTSNESEADRIKKSGGFLFSVSGGTKRVNGSLTVTRAIGDVGLKPFVIGDPEVDVYEVEKTKDKFVILGSDGFYDAIPYDGDLGTVCEQVEQKMKDRENIPTSEQGQGQIEAPTLADLLCEEASSRNNSDNITVVCISLL